jgi:hypothetical protein
VCENKNDGWFFSEEKSMLVNTICCDYLANLAVGGISSDDTVIEWEDTVIVNYDMERKRLFSYAGCRIILQRLDSIFDKGGMISERWENLLPICSYLSIFDILTCDSLLPTLLPMIKEIIHTFIQSKGVLSRKQYLAVFLGYMITLKLDDPKLPPTRIVGTQDTALNISCTRWGSSALYEGFNHYMMMDNVTLTAGSTDGYNLMFCSDIKILLQSVLHNFFNKSDVLVVSKSIQKSPPPAGFKFVAKMLTFIDDKIETFSHVATACSSSNDKQFIKTIERYMSDKTITFTKARYRNQINGLYLQLSVYIRLPSSVATFRSKNGSVVTATAARSATGVLRGSAARSATGVLRGTVTGTVTSPRPKWV